MKYLVMALLTLVSISMFAVIRTVDNNNPSAGQYTTIQAAVDASNNDDVIYVYPSTIPYSGFTVNRRLSIYGTGCLWRNTQNPNIRNASISSTVNFRDGANGTYLSGFYGYFPVMYGYNAEYFTSLQIDGCALQQIYNGGWSSNTSTGILLSSCFFSGSATYYINNHLNDGITVLNCAFSQGVTNSKCIIRYASSNISIINSILRSGTRSTFYSASIADGVPYLRNNYFETAGYSESGNVGTSFPNSNSIAYNICSGTSFGAEYNNLNNCSISSLYDQSYAPVVNSLAIDAGDPAEEYNDLDGSRNDIGYLGGPYPFDENGFTSLPTITDISGTLYTSPSQGLQIHIEASSRH